ncbi:MAG: DUF3489 domain-containing protein [Chloroflexia bacterium]
MAKKPTKATKTRSVGDAAPPAPNKAVSAGASNTKQDLVLDLLRRKNGASIEEIVAATDWQPHSVRGFLSGAVKKRLGIDVVSEKNAKTGERRYYVAAIKS